MRSTINTIGLFVNFYAIKHYGLTIVTVVLNSAPLVTVILAYPILGERVSKGTIVTLLIAGAGAALMILGGGTDGSSSHDLGSLLALVANPFCMASATILMRNMRRVNEWVPSAASNLSQILIFGLLAFSQGSDLSFFTKWNAKELLLMVLMSTFSVFS